MYSIKIANSGIFPFLDFFFFKTSLVISSGLRGATASVAGKSVFYLDGKLTLLETLKIKIMANLV